MKERLCAHCVHGRKETRIEDAYDRWYNPDGTDTIVTYYNCAKHHLYHDDCWHFENKKDFKNNERH